jgi:hypothetical protein
MPAGLGVLDDQLVIVAEAEGLAEGHRDRDHS